ncbi:MAG: tetratricopeptide repeat protein [Calditrichaeota bacterium]|nr:tetratricopeptide repeat protein [Calditrichota bacterium]
MSSSLQKKAGGGFILVIIIGAWGYFFLLVAPYEKGKEAFEQGKYEEAISFLSEVKKGERRYTKAQSLIVEAKFEKGKEAFRQSKYEEAISLFLLTKPERKNYQEAQYRIGNSYFNLEAWNDAKKYLEKVEINSKDYQEAQVTLESVNYHIGIKAYEKRNWNEAMRLLSEVTPNSQNYDSAQEILKDAGVESIKVAKKDQKEFETQRFEFSQQYATEKNEIKKSNVFVEANKWTGQFAKSMDWKLWNWEGKIK